MRPTSLPTARPATGLNGHHVLFSVVAFFAVVLAVNGVLLWKAISTHSGLVANEPYRKGLEYNQRIAADAHQRSLGWIATLDAGSAGRIALVLADAAGQPVTRLRVGGMLGRPSTGREDVALAFVEHAPGVYVATTEPLAAGNWRVDVEARTPGTSDKQLDEPVYRMRRRLWLKP